MKPPPRSRACVTSRLKILLSHEEKTFKYHWTSCFTSRTNLPQTYLYSFLYNVVIRKCQMTPTKLNLLSYMIEKFVHYIYQLYVSVVYKHLHKFCTFARAKTTKLQSCASNLFLETNHEICHCHEKQWLISGLWKLNSELRVG